MGRARGQNVRSAMSDSLQPQGLCPARQAAPSMGFSRQEHWSGWPFPSPGALPDPGIEPMSPTSPASAGEFLPRGPWGSRDKELVLVLSRFRSCRTLCETLCEPSSLLCPWDSPGKTTGVGCQFLLLGTFPTQRLTLCL